MLTFWQHIDSYYLTGIFRDISAGMSEFLHKDTERNWQKHAMHYHHWKNAKIT